MRALFPLRFIAAAAFAAGALSLTGCAGGSSNTGTSTVAPTALSYPQTTISATSGTPIAIDAPTVSGSPSTFSVSPALPAGLTLNSTTGVISGTPTITAASASYVIVAMNSAGSTTVTITIAVSAAVVPPSALSYPQTTITATAGTAIATDTPSIAGSAATFSVSPSLPAGLALSSTSGAISGTPTTAIAAGNYTITATNSAGSATATISIAVSAPVIAPSGLTYPQPTIAATAGTAIAIDTPTISGSATTFSSSPSLPAGILLNANTGSISGTPTTVVASTNYVITATNISGVTTATINISVNAPGPTAPPLLDLGLSASVSSIQMTPARTLSVGDQWVLSDTTTATTIAEGTDGGGIVSQSGTLIENTFAIPVSGGVNIHSATDGHIVTGISFGGTPSWWALSSDASYVAAGNAGGMGIWSTSNGAKLFTKAGNYSAAKVFAAASALQIALGAVGNNVIETISPTTFTSTTGTPFSGYFESWFTDGTNFITVGSNVVWIYSAASVQQNIVSTSASYAGFGGVGNYFWLATSNIATSPSIAIYPLNSANPAAVYPFSTDGIFSISGTTLFIAPYGTASATIVDLSRSTPTQATYTVPIAYLTAFAALSPSQWLVGNWNGVVVDNSSTPRYFTKGSAWSIVGGTNYAAVSVASGGIYVFSPTSTVPVVTLPFNAGNLSISSDGTVLAAQAETFDNQYEPDRSLYIYSLPSGTTFGFSSVSNVNSQNGYIESFSLSGAGNVLAFESAGAASSSNPTCSAVPAAGGAPIWSQTFVVANSFSFYASGCRVVVSPDGTLLGVTNVVPNSVLMESSNIIKNGQLVTAVPAQITGWLDNNTLLANTYTVQPGTTSVNFVSAVTYDASGNNTGTTSWTTPVQLFQPINSNYIFQNSTKGSSGFTNPVIRSTSTGTVVTGTPGGPYVLYVSQDHVYAQPI